MSTEPDSVSERTQVSTRSERRAENGGGGWLVAMGGVMLLGGMALSVGPLVSWKAQKVCAGLAGLGIHGGAIVMGGIGLMALGTVRRSIERMRSEAQRDDGFLIEQMATDVVEIRDAMAAVESESHEIQAQFALLRSDVTALRQTPAPTQTESPMSPDALFQMAASLDKLAQRIDQRLRTFETSLHESVDELSARIESTRRTVEEISHGAASSTTTSPAKNQGARAALAPVAPPQVPSGPSLGLLDSLHDDPPAALPSAQHEGLDFDSLDANAGELARELDQTARAASGPWDEELMVDHSRTDETRGKLEQLQSLLSDDRLRAALDQMRRG